MQQPVELISVELPPKEQRQQRSAQVVLEGEKSNRYTLPKSLDSHSPVGYRQRVPISKSEAKQVAALLSLERPTSFVAGVQVSEQELFEEASLGILSSRQSTNFRGFKQFTVGPEKAVEVAEILRGMKGAGEVLDNASHCNIIISQPYRTPFTMLLTFVGHKAFASLGTVPMRAWNKKYHFVDDIPTIGYLQYLHLGILADGMERASVISSKGSRKANILLQPFCDNEHQQANREDIQKLEQLIGLTKSQRLKGWRIRLEPSTSVGVSSTVALDIYQPVRGRCYNWMNFWIQKL